MNLLIIEEIMVRFLDIILFIWWFKYYNFFFKFISNIDDEYILLFIDFFTVHRIYFIIIYFNILTKMKKEDKSKNRLRFIS
jgi:hypothetical protein